MNCRKCNRRPCQCKISTTTTNCSTNYCAPTVVPPTICAPGSSRPTPPKITIEDLLKLIESKCDKEICQLLQYEIELLYLLLELERPTLPPGTNPPGVIVPPVHHKKFQLIANMVDTLQGGKLKDKYPSAQLLKDELLSLWQCMYNKQQHHGDWSTNFTYRDVIQFGDDKKCLLDGGKDSAPDKIKVITPVDAGSTVFNMVNGKRCLFESLVDNNTTEPTKLSVLDGKWINFCDLKAVIDCVLPRTKASCKDACDPANPDGVIEGKTLCERVNCVTNVVNAIKGIPTGAVTFVSGITGEFTMVLDGHPYKSEKGFDIYKFLCSKKIFTVKDYPALGNPGLEIILSLNASMMYRHDDKGDGTKGNGTQWGTIINVDGVEKKHAGEGYALNRTNENSTVADNGSVSVWTTGKDLEVEFCYSFFAPTGNRDTVYSDMGSATITFSANVDDGGIKC